MRFGTAQKRRVMLAAAVGAVMSVLAACGQKPVDGARIEASAKDGVEWLTHGRTYDEQRFSPLDQINDKTIGKLSLAWYADLDTNRGQEATPIVADGVIYTTSAWSKVFAYEAVSGKLLWSYDPQISGPKGYEACCDVVNRGVAIWKGRVFVGALDGRLIALNAKDGKVAWSVQTTDTTKPYTITGAPRVVKGKVIIGNGGAEYGVRGYVSAYDAETGKLDWRFYTAPNPEGKPDNAASDDIMTKAVNSTWGANGKWKELGGGGTVWDAIVYDKDFNQIIIGVGNGSPWNRRIRSGDAGDNLFLSSVVALDADTGAYKWHFQETPGEEWDFTATQPIILADLTIDGKPVKTLMHAPKNGFFYVIDRATGKPVSATPYVPVNWADGYDEKTWRPIERKEARYSENGGNFIASPSAFGAHNWHPMAYSPDTGLVYIPAQTIPFGYQDDKNFTFAPGRFNLGDTSPYLIGPRNAAGMKAMKAAMKAELIGWDPVAKKARFTIPYDRVGYGGLLATKGNLIFQGAPDGHFNAYSADKGEKLWSFDAQTGVIAGAASFSIEGTQYIAVMAGFGGSTALSAPTDIAYKRPNGRLLVFKLDGAATLPPVDVKPLPAADFVGKWTKADVAKGELLYAGNCGLCHGPSGYGSGMIPDLRRSVMAANKESFNAVVLNGALEDRGMINFSKWISASDAELIRGYLASRAKDLKQEEASANAKSGSK